MMRFTLAAIVSFSLFSSTMLAASPRKGFVLCSSDYPSQIGFRLVQFKDIEKAYEGSFSLNENVVLKGMFDHRDQHFTLAIINVDEFENEKLVLQTSSELATGEIFKLTFPMADDEGAVRLASIICHSHWSL